MQHFYGGVLSVLILAMAGSASGGVILALDTTRTGNGGHTGSADRTLGQPSMVDATNILINRGFTIGMRPNFLAANTVGGNVLFTGLVDIAFTAQEISDIQAFVIAGGGLVIMRDWDSLYPAADALLASFGVTYDTTGYGIVNNPANVNKLVDHPIWTGPAGAVTSYQQGYSASAEGALTPIGNHQTNPTEMGLAVKTVGLGRVVFLTDVNAWDSVGETIIPTAGNANGIVWANIFEWAAVPEPSSALLCIPAGLALARRRRA